MKESSKRERENESVNVFHFGAKKYVSAAFCDL
jgi:hypothetical protein